VLVRLAPDAHPIAAAFWRTALVAALLSPGLRAVGRRDAALIVFAGACLAGHFWSWFASLGATTVLRSTVLVCLTPVWAGLLEWAALRNPPAPRFWLGVAIALAGVALMSAGGEGPEVGWSARGDGLATLGGALGACYLVVGRSVRQRVGIHCYGSLICAAAAAWLLAAAAAVGTPLAGFEGRTWAALGAMALGPQLLGHIGMNYAVGYLPAAVVTAVVLLEPVGAGALAWLVLGEAPTVAAAAGGAVILAGVLLGTLPPRALTAFRQAG